MQNPDEIENSPKQSIAVRLTVYLILFAVAVIILAFVFSLGISFKTPSPNAASSSSSSSQNVTGTIVTGFVGAMAIGLAIAMCIGLDLVPLVLSLVMVIICGKGIARLESSHKVVCIVFTVLFALTLAGSAAFPIILALLPSA